MVYTASKHAQKVTQAPSSVSLVTREDIQTYGHGTLSDVLRMVPGLYVTQDRNYAFLGFRGLAIPGDYNTRALLLVDGHRLNDNVYSTAFIGTEFPIDVDLIERVEVIRGPSSSIYGNNAFLGVINVITRSGSGIDGAEAAVSTGGLGAFDSYRARFTFGKTLTNDLELVLSGSVFGSRGDENLFYPEFNDPATNNGRAERSDEDYSQSGFLKLRYRALTLASALGWRKKNVPTASYGTIFNDGHEQTTDARSFVELTYEENLNPETHLAARLSYDRYLYYGDYPYDAAAPGDPLDRIINRDDVTGDWVRTSVDFRRELFDRHVLTLGVEYQQDVKQHQENFDVNPRATYFHNDTTGHAVGLFAQGEITLRTNLLLNAGLRYDHSSAFGSELNPRLGVIYDPWDRTTFKVLYGEAFRAPNAYELFYESADTPPSNPNLKPESIRTIELVGEHYLPGGYRFSLAGYQFWMDDLIRQTPAPGPGDYLFDNLAKVVAKGIELQAAGRFEHGLAMQASYALQRTEQADTGNELVNSPRHLLKFNASIPLPTEKLLAGIELQYHGRVLTLGGNKADDFFVLNSTLLSRELIRGLDVSVSIYNLLDARYSYPGSADHTQNLIAQNGRSFRLKLTYHF
ncbi:MAG TPA: TonB-dependent receptor [Methylomirabilota bacterium]|nr:TonB-dependent receptor [Methylomirabilota bacterium]